MEKVNERITDYMLRYTADIPADEIARHETFSPGCRCKPDVNFNFQNDWTTIKHKPMKAE